MQRIDRTLFCAARSLRRIRALLPSRKMAVKFALFAGFVAVLRAYFNLPYWQAVGSAFAVYLATGGWWYTWVVMSTFPRDFMALMVLFRIKGRLKNYLNNNTLVHDVFREQVKKHPDRVAFLYEDKQWTFKEVDNLTNRIGNYFYERGYKKGDCVSIFVENSPEVVFLWLGLSKVGVACALINYSLKKDGFAHCVSVSNSRGLIFGPKFLEVVQEAVPRLDAKIEYFCAGPTSSSSSDSFKFAQLDADLKQTSNLPTPIIDGRKSTDLLLYIYTSGTTGLPKGAKISHIRFMFMSYGSYFSFHLKPHEIFYTTIPLYHSAGGVVGAGQVVLNGHTMAVRGKFSASRFWDEAAKYNATVIQYIGEICRYLLDQPVRPSESQHKVRVAIGNGLRPAIWREFKDRFRINQIAEFYGATEGNSNMSNMTGREGAVGFTSMLAPNAYPIKLIKVDEVTGKPIRGPDGLCIFAKPGEQGELVGKIIKGDPLRDFHGYADSKATETKIVHDVIEKGDCAFLSGDVLVMDEYGYFYFKDRSGDTFRWKGENVSTMEVEAIMSNIIGLSDVIVFGVSIPGADGKAGMAAIANLQVDLKMMNSRMQEALPPYARPIFIKLVESINKTGTTKFQKTTLVKEGFDPSRPENQRLFVMHPKTKQYEPLDPATYQDILHKKLRF